MAKLVSTHIQFAACTTLMIWDNATEEEILQAVRNEFDIMEDRDSTFYVMAAKVEDRCHAPLRGSHG